jgi:hypothetical protein
MHAHSDYPELSELPALVHQQRRLLAGQIRITREERDLRERMDALLATSGLEVVTCATGLGPFEVRRAVARDGHRYVSVTPIKDETPGAPSAGGPHVDP